MSFTISQPQNHFILVLLLQLFTQQNTIAQLSASKCFFSDFYSRNNKMPPTKKTIIGKSEKRESTAPQDVKPTTSISTRESVFPSGTEIHEHLRTQLRIPAKTDTRGPPTVLYRTAHAQPTRQAAQDLPSEPSLETSAAESAPHLLPPSRNGIYPTMVVNDFYESISVNHTAHRLPPVPKVPLKTKDIRTRWLHTIQTWNLYFIPKNIQCRRSFNLESRTIEIKHPVPVA